MIIRSLVSSDYFELNIDRYQYADETRLGNDDLQWLYITIRASISERAWECTDPSLMFREAKRLAGWLRQIAVGEPVETEEDFLEPNISFELIRKFGDISTIRVYFELESRPPWKPPHGIEDDWHQIYVELRITNQELMKASEDILADLRSLPPRKGLSL